MGTWWDVILALKLGRVKQEEEACAQAGEMQEVFRGDTMGTAQLVL